MAKELIAGEQRRGVRYVKVKLEELVGKTIEAIVRSTVDSPYGKELMTVLYFTDGTRHGFVHPTEEG